MKSFKLSLINVACILLLFTPGLAFALELEKLNSDLVQLDGKKLEKAKDIDLASKKYVAFYYSAHWCPPCRAFTPELSKFYDKMQKKHGDDFELVFVSSDQSAAAMAEYMEWGDMEFPALAFKGKGAQMMGPFGARGIPYLVVLDQNGKEVLGKGKEDWVHPGKLLPELKDLLE
ncbi:MAG: thioredoxin-like domain-containing protein [Verrucomicrobiota bacterium]